MLTSTSDFDVIVFPDASKDVLTKGKYKRFDRYVSNDYPPQFRKPISKKGLGKLTEFITGGGVVVSWGESTGLFTEGLPLPNNGEESETLELPVRDVSEELKGVSVPGAFLAVDLIPDHFLTWGMPEKAGAFSRGSPVFATSIPVLDTDRRVIGIYPERELLLSGFIEGQEAAPEPSIDGLGAGRKGTARALWVPTAVPRFDTGNLQAGLQLFAAADAEVNSWKRAAVKDYEARAAQGRSGVRMRRQTKKPMKANALARMKTHWKP